MRNRIIIPRKLNLESIIEQNPPKEVDRFHIDRAYLLIYQIIHRKPVDENNGFVNLHSKILSKWVSNSNQYWKYLIRVGVIECDGIYIRREKALGYRIVEKYQSKGRYYEITHWNLLHAWNKGLFKQDKPKKKFTVDSQTVTTASDYTYSSSTALPVFEKKPEPIVIRWESDITITLDEEVYEYLDSAYSDSYKDSLSYNYRLSQIEKIKNYEWVGKISPKCIRLSFWFSQVPKDMRPYILINGEYMTEIDLKNSQLFFSLLLFEVWFYEEANKFLVLTDYIGLYRRFLFSSSPLSSLTLIHLHPPPSNKFFETPETLNKPDISLYRFLVQSGKFYQWFSNRVYEEFGERFEGRAIKDMFFQAVFSSNRFKGQPEARYKRLLIKYLPNVMKVFAVFQKNGKLTLPHLLEIIEAHFFVFQFHFGMPQFSVIELHDALFTPMSQGAEVQKAMHKIIMEETGMMPISKLERVKNEGGAS